MAWEPITSAPTDGTRILLYVKAFGEDDYGVAAWNGHYWDLFYPSDDYAEDDIETDKYLRMFGQPTHWRELEAPQD